MLAQTQESGHFRRRSLTLWSFPRRSHAFWSQQPAAARSITRLLDASFGSCERTGCPRSVTAKSSAALISLMIERYAIARSMVVVPYSR
jgi:hypothetical protein